MAKQPVKQPNAEPVDGGGEVRELATRVRADVNLRLKRKAVVGGSTGTIVKPSAYELSYLRRGDFPLGILGFTARKRRTLN